MCVCERERERERDRDRERHRETENELENKIKNGNKYICYLISPPPLCPNPYILSPISLSPTYRKALAVLLQTSTLLAVAACHMCVV
jgi:hypothetical protein